MEKSLALGTFSYAAISSALIIAIHEVAGLSSGSYELGTQLATFLIAIPIALIAACRIGRITHASLLLICVLFALTALAINVFTLNSIAQPVGGHFGWGDLFNSRNWLNTVLGTTRILVIPQMWLWLINRMAANNSFKPRPLRGLGNGGND